VSQALPQELHIQVIYKNQSAVDLLSNAGQLSQQQLIQCFENGAVWLESTGKPQRLYDTDSILKPGQKIHCYCNQTTLQSCPYQAELVQDFIQFSIWNKPSGMLSQGSKWGDHWALYRWIKQHVWPDRDSYITHRLDRFTSGLIIVAHNKTTNQQFHRLFEKREIYKTYRAIVSGLIPQDQQFTVDSKIDNKNAKTSIKVIDRQVSKEQSLVVIKPETGRKHQIRIHLANIQHPVINDRQYGKPPFSGDLKLQASELEFTHPGDNNKISISLPCSQLLGF